MPSSWIRGKRLKVKQAGKVGTIRVAIKYSVILVFLLGLASIIIFRSLFKIIAAGLILSYIFYPLYNRFYSIVKIKTVAALLITIFVLVILTVPTFLVANKLRTEVSVAFVVAKQYVEGGVKSVKCEGSGLCQLIPSNLKDANPQVKALLTNTLGKGPEYIFNKITQTLLSLPSILLNLFITFFIVYYTFKDGRVLIDKIKKALPLRKPRQDAIIAQFNNVTSAVIYGTVVVAVLQGILAGIGFYVFGMPSPVTWAIITLIFALIPFLGPYVVWLPASLLLIGTGYYSNEGLVFLRGIGLFLYGMLIVSGIDNVLKPKLIADRAKIHPALVLIGILGGVNFFGIVGFVIGPVIMAMFSTAFDTYIKEREQTKAVDE